MCYHLLYSPDNEFQCKWEISTYLDMTGVKLCKVHVFDTDSAEISHLQVIHRDCVQIAHHLLHG